MSVPNLLIVKAGGQEQCLAVWLILVEIFSRTGAVSLDLYSGPIN